MPGYDDDLRLAHVLADAVERVTTARFRADDLRVDSKPDLTLVSDADRDAEELIRSPAQAHPPARRRHRRGVRAHRVQPPPVGRRPDRRHAQLRAGGAGVGHPHRARRRRHPGPRPRRGARPGPPLVGGPGSGAWAGRSLTSARQIHVSQVSRLEDASLSCSSWTSWAAVDRQEQVLDLARSCWRERAYGDFWSYMLLAEGAVDIAAEPELGLHDMAALVPVVTEAGGRFTSLAGVDGPYGGNAVATNGILHDEVLAPHRHRLSRTRGPRQKREPWSASVARPRGAAAAPCAPGRRRTR